MRKLKTKKIFLLLSLAFGTLLMTATNIQAIGLNDGSSCRGQCIAPENCNGTVDSMNSCGSDNLVCCLPSSGSSTFPDSNTQKQNTTSGTPTTGGFSGGYPMMQSNAWGQGLMMAGIVSGLPATSADNLFVNLLVWILRIFIILAFISFIINGVMFILAGIDKDMATRARTGIGYSILALVVAFSAFIIINLINQLLQASGSTGFGKGLIF